MPKIVYFTTITQSARSVNMFYVNSIMHWKSNLVKVMNDTFYHDESTLLVR